MAQYGAELEVVPPEHGAELEVAPSIYDAARLFPKESPELPNLSFAGTLSQATLSSIEVLFLTVICVSE